MPWSRRAVRGVLAALFAVPALAQDRKPLQCVVEGLPYDLSESLCRRAQRAEHIFKKLLASPDLAGKKRPRLIILASDGDVNAYHHKGEIQLTRGYLERFGDDEEVMAHSLAHELGHYIQYLGWSSDLWKLGFYGAKQMESSADALGARLLTQAGYTLDTAPNAYVRRMQGCGGGGGTHPLNKDRWFNFWAMGRTRAPSAGPSLQTLSESAADLSANPGGRAGRLEKMYTGGGGGVGSVEPGAVSAVVKPGTPLPSLKPRDFDQDGKAKPSAIYRERLEKDIPPVPPLVQFLAPVRTLRSIAAQAAERLLKDDWAKVQNLAIKGCGTVMGFDGAAAAAEAGYVDRLRKLTEKIANELMEGFLQSHERATSMGR